MNCTLVSRLRNGRQSALFGKRLSVLVIEDESHVATLLERMPAKAGHKVFTALSGRERLAIFGKERVDVVVCDLGMPGMSGWDVGKAIRSACPEKGIAKPIDSASLLATIQEIAGRFDLDSRDA